VANGIQGRGVLKFSKVARAYSDRMESSDRNTLKINLLEHVLIGKVSQLFRNML
jgi:hypothetical protein